VIAHVEEIVLATSGEDAFELLFALAAARLVARGAGSRRPRAGPRKPVGARELREAIAAAGERRPELEVSVGRAPDRLLLEVDALLDRALAAGEGRSPLEALDAVFESLVPRLAKGDKGQFFTPRHVVDFVIRALAPTGRDVLVDPACGSGAFLAHARSLSPLRTFGCDVDARAVRIARLIAIAQGRDVASVARADGLRDPTLDAARATLVATNPPFAGRAPAEGFEAADLVKTPERDVLFLERALALLRPGGRLGIVLPYNKAAGGAFAALRRWLVERAHVAAVVGLPRETFLPHTSQRTFVLFARKRRLRERPKAGESVMLVASERAGKDSAGEPVLRPDGTLDHDLDEVLDVLRPFLRAQELAS